MKQRKAKFEIDGIDGKFEGWTTGQTWNGWATPAFEKLEAQRLMDAILKQEGASAQFVEDKDAFVTQDSDALDPEVWDSFNIDTDDGVKHVYAVGSHAWCWDEVTE